LIGIENNENMVAEFVRFALRVERLVRVDKLLLVKLALWTISLKARAQSKS
jgi:hypothetical protein